MVSAGEQNELSTHEEARNKHGERRTGKMTGGFRRTSTANSSGSPYPALDVSIKVGGPS